MNVHMTKRPAAMSACFCQYHPDQRESFSGQHGKDGIRSTPGLLTGVIAKSQVEARKSTLGSDFVQSNNNVLPAPVTGCS